MLRERDGIPLALLGYIGGPVPTHWTQVTIFSTGFQRGFSTLGTRLALVAALASCVASAEGPLHIGAGASKYTFRNTVPHPDARPPAEAASAIRKLIVSLPSRKDYSEELRALSLPVEETPTAEHLRKSLQETVGRMKELGNVGLSCQKPFGDQTLSTPDAEVLDDLGNRARIVWEVARARVESFGGKYPTGEALRAEVRHEFLRIINPSRREEGSNRTLGAFNVLPQPGTFEDQVFETFADYMVRGPYDLVSDIRRLREYSERRQRPVLCHEAAPLGQQLALRVYMTPQVRKVASLAGVSSQTALLALHGDEVVGRQDAVSISGANVQLRLAVLLAKFHKLPKASQNGIYEALRQHFEAYRITEPTPGLSIGYPASGQAVGSTLFANAVEFSAALMKMTEQTESAAFERFKKRFGPIAPDSHAGAEGLIKKAESLSAIGHRIEATTGRRKGQASELNGKFGAALIDGAEGGAVAASLAKDLDGLHKALKPVHAHDDSIANELMYDLICGAEWADAMLVARKASFVGSKNERPSELCVKRAEPARAPVPRPGSIAGGGTAQPPSGPATEGGSTPAANGNETSYEAWLQKVGSNVGLVAGGVTNLTNDPIRSAKVGSILGGDLGGGLGRFVDSVRSAASGSAVQGAADGSSQRFDFGRGPAAEPSRAVTPEFMGPPDLRPSVTPASPAQSSPSASRAPSPSPSLARTPSGATPASPPTAAVARPSPRPTTPVPTPTATESIALLDPLVGPVGAHGDGNTSGLRFDPRTGKYYVEVPAPKGAVKAVSASAPAVGIGGSVASSPPSVASSGTSPVTNTYFVSYGGAGSVGTSGVGSTASGSALGGALAAATALGKNALPPGANGKPQPGSGNAGANVALASAGMAPWAVGIIQEPKFRPIYDPQNNYNLLWYESPRWRDPQNRITQVQERALASTEIETVRPSEQIRRDDPLRDADKLDVKKSAVFLDETGNVRGQTEYRQSKDGNDRLLRIAEVDPEHVKNPKAPKRVRRQTERVTVKLDGTRVVALVQFDEVYEQDGKPPRVENKIVKVTTTHPDGTSETVEDLLHEGVNVGTKTTKTEGNRTVQEERRWNQTTRQWMVKRTETRPNDDMATTVRRLQNELRASDRRN